MRFMEWAFMMFVAVAAFLYVVFGYPTPEERMRVRDSMGRSTGVNWR